jgi:hypothetical protein
LEGLLRVYPGKLTKEEESLIRSSLPTALQFVTDYGFISDAQFEEMGFGLDERPDGTKVPARDPGAAEHFQRGRILTHSGLVLMRAEVAKAAELALARKQSLAQAQALSVAKCGLEAERKLAAACSGNNELLTLVHFKSLLVPELKKFIADRRAGGVKAGYVWPKKGDLVQEAFSLRAHATSSTTPAAGEAATPPALDIAV